MDTQRDILAAIILECAATPEFCSFPVTGIEREGAVCKVFVVIMSPQASSLEESFKGARGWWDGDGWWRCLAGPSKPVVKTGLRTVSACD